MQQNALMTSKDEIFGLLTQNVGLDQGTWPLIGGSGNLFSFLLTLTSQ